MMRWTTAVMPLALLPAMLLAACGSNSGAAGGNAATPVADDDVIGRWNGPEGLYFQITAGSGQGKYTILNRWTLDDEASFTGTRNGDAIDFVREGEQVSAKPGTGADTGFKWLADKQDCLIVQAGVEGYCRD